VGKKSKFSRAEERRRERRKMGNLYLASEGALTPGTLIDGARMYATSADAVNAKFPCCVFPISHLLCTSIELTLKAFLRFHGATEDRLMELGHDLSALLTEAVTVGLHDTGSRMLVLAVVGKNYTEKLFVYPEQNPLGMQSIAPYRLRAMCHELIVEVFAAIKGAEDATKMKNEPGLCIQGNYPADLPPMAASMWAARPIDLLSFSKTTL
jgi:hypothetical protein